MLFLGCEADVSLFKHFGRRVSVCEWARFSLMLISCWTAAGDISFGWSALSARTALSRARFLLLSVAFCSE